MLEEKLGKLWVHTHRTPCISAKLPTFYRKKCAKTTYRATMACHGPF